MPSNAESGPPSSEELAQLHRLARALDDLMEESLKTRESLAQSFRRIFPQLLTLTGAKGIVITTRDEELIERTFSEGDFGSTYPGHLLAGGNFGLRREGADTLVSQALDVVGIEVGSIGLLFAGDRVGPPDGARLGRVLETVAEQLDNALAVIHTAAEKHQLILQFNQYLSNRVFEKGMDQAVLALAQRVRVPGFMLVFKDAVQTGSLHYRTYRNGHLEYESGEQPFPALEELIRRQGPELISAQNAQLRTVVGEQRCTEAVLISSGTSHEPLGKIIVWSGDDGFSSFTLDLLRVLASTLSQRLIDYNRERIHLSQFFSAGIIDELLQDPSYASRYLTPRDEQVGILFADINGFTRICEQVLESPSRIGRFVDRWSDGVVDILWRHRGVFDKMVGDCVIGIFGPPFFRTSGAERAAAAMRAAMEIQAFTEGMSSDPEVVRIKEQVNLPGLGVAIGIHLANTFCGVFGPNQQYTGFSTGMNQTARLQSLGGFRETLVMEPLRRALETSEDPAMRALQYGERMETPVKNVAQPLRYFRLIPPGAK
ncbi:MAG: adenylate/guanylate cyclase domain-containing protein [Myxococcota bacterium]|nr:adenylate/guanylate cyclase domain-containing protein [Myxococcota bacterium]